MVSNTLIIAFFSIVTVTLLAIIYGLKSKLNSADETILAQQRSLTDLKKLQKKSDLAKSDAIAANLAKNRYLSGISHELRTPLNVIMGYAQLLENQSNDQDINHKKYTLIRHNSEHLAHLIDGILEFSAIESGKLKVKFEPINLNDLLNQIIMMFKNQAEQKGLSFSSQVDPNLPEIVKTDYKRLQQIIINLLSNAIKFTQQGQVKFIITYRNQVATFEIKDSGCGIDSSNLNRIFEPFERIETPNNSVTGTGLGLPITKLLVELLGGELTVNSELNQGSQFKVKMMLSSQSSVHQSTTTQQTKTKQTDTKANKQLQLLVVDDESSHRDLLQDILKPHGFSITTAADANQAQQLFKQCNFVLAIIDVAMPGIDGWQLASWVKKTYPKVKVIMLSANPRDSEASTNRHHDIYLTKPVKINQLLNSLNQLLKLDLIDSQLNEVNSCESKPNNNILSEINTADKGSTETWVLNKQATTALLNMIEIGHINGIETYLNKLLNDQQITANQHQLLHQPIKQMNLESFKAMIDHEHH